MALVEAATSSAVVPGSTQWRDVFGTVDDTRKNPITQRWPITPLQATTKRLHELLLRVTSRAVFDLSPGTYFGPLVLSGTSPCIVRAAQRGGKDPVIITCDSRNCPVVVVDSGVGVIFEDITFVLSVHRSGGVAVRGTGSCCFRRCAFLSSADQPKPPPFGKLVSSSWFASLYSTHTHTAQQHEDANELQEVAQEDELQPVLPVWSALQEMIAGVEGTGRGAGWEKVPEAMEFLSSSVLVPSFLQKAEGTSVQKKMIKSKAASAVSAASNIALAIAGPTLIDDCFFQGGFTAAVAVAPAAMRLDPSITLPLAKLVNSTIDGYFGTSTGIAVVSVPLEGSSKLAATSGSIVGGIISGGTATNACRVSIEGCNIVRVGGCGIIVSGSATATVKRCTILGANCNSKTAAHGIVAESSSKLWAEDCCVSSAACEFEGGSGLVICGAANAEVHRCLFCGNQGQRQVVLEGSSCTTLRHSVVISVTDNTAVDAHNWVAFGADNADFNPVRADGGSGKMEGDGDDGDKSGKDRRESQDTIPPVEPIDDLLESEEQQQQQQTVMNPEDSLMGPSVGSRIYLAACLAISDQADVVIGGSCFLNVATVGEAVRFSARGILADGYCCLSLDDSEFRFSGDDNAVAVGLGPLQQNRCVGLQFHGVKLENTVRPEEEGPVDVLSGYGCYPRYVRWVPLLPPAPPDAAKKQSGPPTVTQRISPFRKVPGGQAGSTGGHTPVATPMSPLAQRLSGKPAVLTDAPLAAVQKPEQQQQQPAKQESHSQIAKLKLEIEQLKARLRTQSNKQQEHQPAPPSRPQSARTRPQSARSRPQSASVVRPQSVMTAGTQDWQHAARVGRYTWNLDKLDDFYKLKASLAEVRCPSAVPTDDPSGGEPGRLHDEWLLARKAKEEQKRREEEKQKRDAPKITADGLKEHVARVYERPLKAKQNNREKFDRMREQQMLDDRRGALYNRGDYVEKLTPKQERSFVKRMFYGQKEHTEKVNKALKKKYIDPAVKRNTKRLNEEEIRIYCASMHLGHSDPACAAEVGDENVVRTAARVKASHDKRVKWLEDQQKQHGNLKMTTAAILAYSNSLYKSHMDEDAAWEACQIMKEEKGVTKDPELLLRVASKSRSASPRKPMVPGPPLAPRRNLPSRNEHK